MGRMIASIGIVFGKIFNRQMEEYLPFLALGIILWAFITRTINEVCTCFIDAEGSKDVIFSTSIICVEASDMMLTESSNGFCL
jgi:ABC-type polysaccharide/polyol phosphate export permease